MMKINKIKIMLLALAMAYGGKYEGYGNSKTKQGSKIRRVRKQRPKQGKMERKTFSNLKSNLRKRERTLKNVPLKRANPAPSTAVSNVGSERLYQNSRENLKPQNPHSNPTVSAARTKKVARIKKVARTKSSPPIVSTQEIAQMKKSQSNSNLNPHSNPIASAAKPIKESENSPAFQIKDLESEDIFEGCAAYAKVYEQLREELGFKDKDLFFLGKERMDAWKNNLTKPDPSTLSMKKRRKTPNHSTPSGKKRKKSSRSKGNSQPEKHPLRISIENFFKEGRNYTSLMKRAENIIQEAGKIPGFHFWSVREISEVPGQVDGGDKFPEFQVVLGLPVESLQHFNPDSSNIFEIVQVASQFNGLESRDIEISPLKDWVGDSTQGPGACLGALLASALRCATQEKGELPDAIEPLLGKCKAKSGNAQLICKKYPQLYVNGYLQLAEIKDVEDLEFFAEQLKDNINELGILCQKVKCEESRRTQLQVFCAAPSFQGYPVDWNANDRKISAYKEICQTLLVAEYGALAQLACSFECQLHLTLVGMGAFNNPREAIDEALKAVIEKLKGSKVKVFLHGYQRGDIEKWNAALGFYGYPGVNIEEFSKDQSILSSQKK